MKYLPFRT